MTAKGFRMDIRLPSFSAMVQGEQEHDDHTASLGRSWSLYRHRAVTKDAGEESDKGNIQNRVTFTVSNLLFSGN